jgi:hypothetical protein
LCAAACRGELRPIDRIWREGEADWVAATDYPALFTPVEQEVMDAVPVGTSESGGEERQAPPQPVVPVKGVVTCDVCRARISSEARACPKCGHPHEDSGSIRRSKWHINCACSEHVRTVNQYGRGMCRGCGKSLEGPREEIHRLQLLEQKVEDWGGVGAVLVGVGGVFLCIRLQQPLMAVLVGIAFGVVLRERIGAYVGRHWTRPYTEKAIQEYNRENGSSLASIWTNYD